MSGIAIGCARWTGRGRVTPFILALTLVICNLFPTRWAPTSNQKPRPETDGRICPIDYAINFRPGSFLFTDNGGGLSLSSICREERVCEYEEPFSAFSSVQLQWLSSDHARTHF